MYPKTMLFFFYFQDQEYALGSHSRKQKCFLCLQTWYKNFNFPKCRREMFLIWKVSRALQRTPLRTDWKLNSVDKLMVMDLSSYARLEDFRKEKRGSDIMKYYAWSVYHNNFKLRCVVIICCNIYIFVTWFLITFLSSIKCK